MKTIWLRSKLIFAIKKQKEEQWQQLEKKIRIKIEVSVCFAFKMVPLQASLLPPCVGVLGGYMLQRSRIAAAFLFLASTVVLFVSLMTYEL